MTVVTGGAIVAVLAITVLVVTVTFVMSCRTNSRPRKKGSLVELNMYCTTDELSVIVMSMLILGPLLVGIGGFLAV